MNQQEYSDLAGLNYDHVRMTMVMGQRSPAGSASLCIPNGDRSDSMVHSCCIGICYWCSNAKES